MTDTRKALGTVAKAKNTDKKDSAKQDDCEVSKSFSITSDNKIVVYQKQGNELVKVDQPASNDETEEQED